MRSILQLHQFVFSLNRRRFRQRRYCTTSNAKPAKERQSETSSTVDANYFVPQTVDGEFCYSNEKEKVKVSIGKDAVSLFLGGVSFTGPCFEQLSSPLLHLLLKAYPKLFPFGSKEFLDKYKLNFKMSLAIGQIDSKGKEVLESGDLEVFIHVDSEQFSSPQLKLKLCHDSSVYVSSGTSNNWNDELFDIQLQMPIHLYIKACFNCALSEYSPLERPTFGGLACFRQAPDVITKVKTPGELIHVWSQQTDRVHELYRCPFFRRRTKERIPPISPRS